MEFISDLKVLSEKFKSLCKTYSHYKWAVAWAGDPKIFNLSKVLKRNQAKIEQVVVGFHFYQTHPDFIAEYMGNNKVKFYKQSDGTFHTKVYLFYNSKNDWSAIIGSSNFTYHGFNKNEEANVLIGYGDIGADFSAISTMVSNLWKKGGFFSLKELEIYRNTFEFQSRKQHSLKHLKTLSGTKIASSLDVMTWDEYFHLITTRDFNSFKTRIELLNKAHSIFQTGISFNSFSPNVKRAIAGFIINSEELNTPDVDWRLFGSMKGAGEFKHAINEISEIGIALDRIPLSGDITKRMFEDYCQAFTSWKNPIACATRLLTIKRPDFFVCINTKNKKRLSELLNIPQSQFTLDNYWDDILDRIHDSVWYNDVSELSSTLEQSIKRFQVAMLDSISYDGK